MAMSEFKFQAAQRIFDAANRHAKADARAAVTELARSLSGSKWEIDDNESQRVMQCLLDRRWFDLASQVGGALVNKGRASREVRRRHAQALIDTGYLHEAQKELAGLAKGKGIPPSEQSEIVGLIGRVQKQSYFNDVKAKGSGKT